MGQLNVAEDLVLRSKQTRENMSNEQLAFIASPSVIVLFKVLEAQTNANEAANRVQSYLAVDNQIVERAVVKLLDIACRAPDRKPFCAKTIGLLLERNPDTVKRCRILISQSMHLRLSNTETVEEVIELLQTSSDLGLKLTHMKEWYVSFLRLIPRDQDYTMDSLLNRVDQARGSLECLTVHSGGVYSTSSLWSQIIHYLLTVNSPLYLLCTAKLIKKLGVAYGPVLWYDNLGKNLIETRDSESFVDILEVGYNNCGKRGDGQDYLQLSTALIVAVKVANKNRVNIDNTLEDTFQQIWARGLLLHPSVKEQLVACIQNRYLAQAAHSLRTIGNNNFRMTIPPRVTLKKRKRRSYDGDT